MSGSGGSRAETEGPLWILDRERLVGVSRYFIDIGDMIGLLACELILDQCMVVSGRRSRVRHDFRNVTFGEVICALRGDSPT